MSGVGGGSNEMVLQVVSKTIETQGSQSLPAYTDVQVGANSDFIMNITPKRNGSRFLIQLRWLGETDTTHNACFNIERDGVRVNELTGSSHAALSMPCQTYSNGGADDSSTPDVMHLATIDDGGSVAGTSIEYKVTCTNGAGATKTLWTNRCFTAPTSGSEDGVSEIIITELRP